MRMQIACTPAQRAAEYLKRVVALTGAEQVGGSYWLRVGRRNFLVDYKFARLISNHGRSTCFYVATDPDMPNAEDVASASLQLQNHARLFWKWRQQTGSPVKVD